MSDRPSEPMYNHLIQYYKDHRIVPRCPICAKPADIVDLDYRTELEFGSTCTMYLECATCPDHLSSNLTLPYPLKTLSDEEVFNLASAWQLYSVSNLDAAIHMLLPTYEHSVKEVLRNATFVSLCDGYLIPLADTGEQDGYAYMRAISDWIRTESIDGAPQFVAEWSLPEEQEV